MLIIFRNKQEEEKYLEQEEEEKERKTLDIISGMKEAFL